MRGKLITLLMFAVVIPVATAQTSGNAFLGYSFEDVASSTGGIVNGNRIVLNGFTASAEIKVYRWLGIVGDYSGHYGSGRQSFPSVFFVYHAQEDELLVGPRASVSFGRIRPFGEVLLGWGFLSLKDVSPGNGSNNSFATAVGGGMDYKIARILALRAEGDYVRTEFFSLTQNNFRLSTGLALRF
jgi:opacity protein-like surface antigen